MIKKTSLLLMLISGLACLAYSQPQAFRYSAVAINPSGNPVMEQISVRFTFHEGNENGAVRYQETHSVTPQLNGKFNLDVGSGSSTLGSFSDLEWGEHQYWLRVALSFDNGLSFDNYGVSQLLSVPYAFYAKESGGTAGDGDSDPGNEIQTLTLSDNTLTLSGGGGSVNLPVGLDAQILSISGSNLSISNGNSITLPPQRPPQVLSLSGSVLSISDGNSINLPAGTAPQTLSLNGDQLSISSGNTVTLPTSADGSSTDELQQLSLDGSELSLSNNGGTVTLPLGTDAQTLTLTGDQLAISNGNSVTLPAAADDSNTNELQQLSLNGNELNLSNNGGTVTLPLGTDAQTLTLTGDQLAISNGNSVTLPTTGDGNNTDELQELSLNGNELNLSNNGGTVTLPLGTDAQTLTLTGDQLAISNGNSVTLPAAADDSNTNELQQLSLNGNELNLSNNGGTVTLPLGTDAQTLTLTGDQLAISNGNSVTLPTTGDGNNTDELQELSLNGNELNLSNNGGTVTLPLGTDAQTLTLTGDQLAISNGNSVTLPAAADDSNTNELQQLSLNGNELNLSNNGGTVTLPLGTDAQILTLTGDQLAISNGNAVTLPTAGDGNTTDELQQLSLNGNELNLSNNGGTVTLPQNTDAQTLTLTGDQLSISNGNAITLPSAADGSSTNELQQLTLTDNVLSLSNGGGQVDLPGIEAGTGIGLSDNGSSKIINASNDDPIWNAVKLRGRPIGGMPPSTAGQIMKYDILNGEWIADTLTGDLETRADGSLQVAALRGRPIGGMPPSKAGQIMKYNIDTGGWEADLLSGDLETLPDGSLQVAALRGRPIGGMPPSKAGQIMKYNIDTGGWEADLLTGDLETLPDGSLRVAALRGRPIGGMPPSTRTALVYLPESDSFDYLNPGGDITGTDYTQLEIAAIQGIAVNISGSGELGDGMALTCKDDGNGGLEFRCVPVGDGGFSVPFSSSVNSSQTMLSLTNSNSNANIGLRVENEGNFGMVAIGNGANNLFNVTTLNSKNFFYPAGVYGENTNTDSNAAGAGVTGRAISGAENRGVGGWFQGNSIGVLGVSYRNGGGGVMGYNYQGRRFTAGGRFYITPQSPLPSGTRQDYWALYAESLNTNNAIAARFVGDVSISGNISKSGGSFRIDHPQDPENKYLYHSFVESPDMKNIYDGVATTDAEGFATVELPDYFEVLNEDFRYQLTCIGTFTQAIIAEKVKDNRFVIQTEKPNVEVSWQITGIRKDPWAENNRIVPEVDKAPEDRGKYLHPEVYGKRAEQKIGVADDEFQK